MLHEDLREKQPHGCGRAVASKEPMRGNGAVYGRGPVVIVTATSTGGVSSGAAVASTSIASPMCGVGRRRGSVRGGDSRACVRYILV